MIVEMLMIDKELQYCEFQKSHNSVVHKFGYNMFYEKISSDYELFIVIT